MSSLKDDALRKDELICIYKAKKAELEAEIQRLDQLVRSLESKVSNLSKTETVKSSLLKDLKRKYEDVVVQASEAEMHSLSTQELLKRVSSLESEKTRLHNRFAATKSKLDTALSQVELLQTESSRIPALEDKVAQLQAFLQRKDSTMKSYKEIADKTSVSMEAMKKEYEGLQAESTVEKRYRTV
jgi:chromosome segregation ATPase